MYLSIWKETDSIETVKVNDKYSNARLPLIWSYFCSRGLVGGFISIDMLPQMPTSEVTLANRISDSVKWSKLLRIVFLISCKHIFDSMMQLVIFM